MKAQNELNDPPPSLPIQLRFKGTEYRFALSVDFVLDADLIALNYTR